MAGESGGQARRTKSPVWSEHEFYIYGRQSDPRSAGNQATGLQEEDLPRMVGEWFGIEWEGNPAVRRYFESESGLDTSTRFEFGQPGELYWQRFRRKELLRLLSEVVERYRSNGKPAVICVSLLNRLGRSIETVMLVSAVAQRLHGNLWIWSADTGILIDPLSEPGHIQLIMMCGIAGKGESRTKSTFVKAARLRIAQTDSSRSLGERWVGYRKHPYDKLGRRLTDIWTKPDHYRHEVDPSQKSIVEDIFQLTLAGIRPLRTSFRIQEKYGNHPHTGRHWTRRTIQGILRNPIYTGRRAYNRKSGIHVGDSRSVRHHPSRYVISPIDPSLRIIDDRTFITVQSLLDAWSGGRDIGIDAAGQTGHLLLYSNARARCAICGSLIRVAKHHGKPKYVCDGPKHVLPGIRCLIADVVTIDNNVVSRIEMGKNSLLPPASGSMPRAGDRSVAAVGTHWRYLLPDVHLSDLPSILRVTSKCVDAASHSSGRQTEEQASDNRSWRRALLDTLAKAIWVWPDGYVWIQRWDEEDESGRDLCGRKVKVSSEWLPVDPRQIAADLDLLVHVGEIPKHRFSEFVSRNTTFALWCERRREPQISTLLKLFLAASNQFLQISRLRSDLKEFIHQRINHDHASWCQIERELGIGRKTARRIWMGLPVRRTSLEIAAASRGLLEQYRVLPEDVALNPHLPEMVQWLVRKGNDSSWREMSR